MQVVSPQRRKGKGLDSWQYMHARPFYSWVPRSSKSDNYSRHGATFSGLSLSKSCRSFKTAFQHSTRTEQFKSSRSNWASQWQGADPAAKLMKAALIVLHMYQVGHLENYLFLLWTNIHSYDQSIWKILCFENKTSDRYQCFLKMG